MGHVRGARADVIREIESAGFRIIADNPLLRRNYFLVFARIGG
jgi:hypothetical protein